MLCFTEMPQRGSVASVHQGHKCIVQSHTHKHSIFKAGYGSIVYFTENSRSKWCMLYCRQQRVKGEKERDREIIITIITIIIYSLMSFNQIVTVKC